MKNQVRFFVILLVITIFLSGCGLLRGPYWRYRQEQKTLAKELGVKISDYPGEGDFPIGYLEAKLNPGMTYEEVHQVIKGYTAVYSCGLNSDFPWEIYYYFSTDDDKAIRYEVLYDIDGILLKTISEDPNSRTIHRGTDCIPGRLGDSRSLAFPLEFTFELRHVECSFGYLR